MNLIESREMQARAESFMDAAIALERYGVDLFAIVELAKKIRKDCLSGYAWNVPANWDEAAPMAQLRWRQRAADALLISFRGAA